MNWIFGCVKLLWQIDDGAGRAVSSFSTGLINGKHWPRLFVDVLLRQPAMLLNNVCVLVCRLDIGTRLGCFGRLGPEWKTRISMRSLVSWKCPFQGQWARSSRACAKKFVSFFFFCQFLGLRGQLRTERWHPDRPAGCGRPEHLTNTAANSSILTTSPRGPAGAFCYWASPLWPQRALCSTLPSGRRAAVFK